MEITLISRVMFFTIFVTQHEDLVYQIIFKSGGRRRRTMIKLTTFKFKRVIVLLKYFSYLCLIV